jgi:hypothetical protein
MYKLLPLLILTACGSPEPAQFYEHPCGNGDPVGIECIDEADYVWEEPSTDLCDDLDIQAGDECELIDEACVLTQAFTCVSLGDGPRSSEELLTCLDEPYDDEATMCPESSRSVKRDIVYVGDAERRELAQQVLDVKLARYNYIDPKKPGRKLGYILEDIPEAPFSSGNHVDMYAYVSAVVALTQEQQREIDRLTKEIQALKNQR